MFPGGVVVRVWGRLLPCRSSKRILYESTVRRVSTQQHSVSSGMQALYFAGHARNGIKPFCAVISGEFLCRNRTAFGNVLFKVSFSTSPVFDDVPKPRTTPDYHERMKMKHRTTLNYTVAFIIFILGCSYAAVPLYRVFCQVTGIGGAANLAQHGGDKVEALQKVTDRKLRIVFNADTASHLHWHFKPLQREVVVYPGETALAFYSAENPTDRPIVGISTYTVLPFDAAKYLNKIQCFCFEEQRLNSHEQVDMPVFFYIDPDFCNDPSLAKCDTITLSYMFFEAKEGVQFQPPQNPYSTPLPAISGLAPA